MAEVEAEGHEAWKGRQEATLMDTIKMLGFDSKGKGNYRKI